MIFVAGVVGEIQESLNSSLTVLWPLSVHAVRENDHNTRLGSPFGLSTNDEVIDDNFSCIHEVSELSLPDSEGVWVGNRVAVLESEHSVLTEMAVGDLHIIRNSLQEKEFFNISLLVTDQGVALRKRSSLAVLSRNSYAVTFFENRSPAERFQSGPIQRFVA